MDPTPTDVQDKSGNGHHPQWDGSGRPALWSSGPVAAMVYLSVTPASSSVEELLTRQFTATAVYDDSSTRNVTNTAAWSSSNTSAATVNSAGLATGQSVGSAKIIAVYNAFRDTADLTVTASTAVLESLVISGNTGTVVKGNTLALSAVAHYSNGSSVDKTASATWSSGNDGLATVNGSGVVTGVDLGQVTIRALYSGKADSVSVQVIDQPAFVKKINFQPASTAVPSGYVPDDGAVYSSSRGYGWASAVAESRERGINADPRYDTFVKTYSATDWTLDLPSAGDYKITVVMGDPGYATANTLSFDDQTLISAASSTNYSTAVETLTVTGTQLVLSVTGAICYIDVESAGGGTPIAPAVSLSPGFSVEAFAPNPFRSRTVLGFWVDAPAVAHVRIYDQAGKIVWSCSEPAPAGRSRVVWDGRDQSGKMLANGVYMAGITVNNKIYSRRVVLLK
jgi:hypothetical protein